MKSKAKTQRNHAIRRFKERFNITLNKDQYLQLCKRFKKQINTRDGVTFVERQSNRVKVWDTHINEIPIRVVWDKKRQAIATVLYPDKEGVYE